MPGAVEVERRISERDQPSQGGAPGPREQFGVAGGVWKPVAAAEYSRRLSVSNGATVSRPPGLQEQKNLRSERFADFVMRHRVHEHPTHPPPSRSSGIHGGWDRPPQRCWRRLEVHP